MSRIAAGALVLALLAPSAGAAQQPNQTAAARALFEEGMRAVDARDWSTAVDRLQRSNDLRPSPVVRYNLALALSELGRFVEATEHLRAVERDQGASADARRLATERLQTILPRLGRLRVVVTGPRTTVQARLDGAPIPEALLGVPQPADPGRHRVALFRAEDELVAREVTVASGQLAEVSLEAPPMIAGWVEDPAGGRRDAPSGGVEGEWWFWTLIGVLVAGAGVGVALAIVYSSAEPLPYVRGDSGSVHPTLVLELP